MKLRAGTDLAITGECEPTDDALLAITEELADVYEANGNTHGAYALRRIAQRLGDGDRYEKAQAQGYDEGYADAEHYFTTLAKRAAEKSKAKKTRDKS